MTESDLDLLLAVAGWEDENREPPEIEDMVFITGKPIRAVSAAAKRLAKTGHLTISGDILTLTSNGWVKTHPEKDVAVKAGRAKGAIAKKKAPVSFQVGRRALKGEESAFPFCRECGAVLLTPDEVEPKKCRSCQKKKKLPEGLSLISLLSQR